MSSASPSTKTSSASEATPAPAPSAVAAVPANVVISDVFAARRAQAYAAALAAEEREPVPYASKPVLEAFTATLRSDAEAVAPLDQNRTAVRPTMRLRQGNAVDLAARERAYQSYQAFLATDEAAASTVAHQPSAKVSLDAFRAKLVSGAPRAQPVSQEHLNKKTKEGEQSTSSAATIRLQVHQSRSTTTRPMMRIVQVPEPTQAYKARREQARVMMERHLADNAPEPVWKPTPKPVLDAFRAQLVSGAPRVAPVPQKQQVKTTVRPTMRIVQAPEPTEAQKARREQARAMMERHLADNVPEPVWKPTPKPVLDAFRAQLVSGAPRVRPVMQKLLNQRVTCLPIRPVPAQLKEELSRRASRHAHPMVSDKKNTASTVHNARALLTTTTTTSNSNCIRNRPMMHIVQAPEPTEAQKARREQARAVTEGIMNNYDAPLHAQLSSSSSSKPVLDAFRAQLISGAPRVRPVPQKQQEKTSVRPTMHIVQAPEPTEAQKARREQARAVMERHLADNAPEPVWKPTPKPVLDAFRAQLVSGAPRVRPVSQANQTERQRATVPRMRIRPAPQQLKEELARREARRAVAQAGMEAFLAADDAEYAHLHAPTPKPVLDAFRAQLISGAPYVAPVAQSHVNKEKNSGSTPVRPAAHHLKAEVARRASRRAEAYAAMQAHYDTQAPAETANVSTPKTSLDAFRATLISGAPRVKPVPQTSHHERRYTGLTSEAQQQIELESHIRQLERLNCL